MVLARITFWQFKDGKRPEAFNQLDTFLNSLAKQAEGFRGYMSILSYDDSNSATIITLWEDEVALNKSGMGIFTHAINEVRQFLRQEPKIEKGRVFSTELFLRDYCRT